MPRRWPALLAIGVLAAVCLRHLVAVLMLAAYPWDWSPDEGLVLDMARRLATGAPPLYSRSVVPFPDFYGPVLPALLAPVVTWFVTPLAPARVLSLAWTALIVAAVYVLVRRRSTPPMAAACAAMALAPACLTQWFALVRGDGPMLALWLWSCVYLLPADLARGADRLSPWRCFLGSLLLVAAVFTKPTAALCAGPVVASWLLVDRASLGRLLLVLAAWIGGVVALLDFLSHGAYLWILVQWTTHPVMAVQAIRVLKGFLLWGGVPLGVAAAGLVAAHRAQSPWWRDSGVALWIGGAMVLPTFGKGGSTVNYTLPWLVVTAVLAGRAWARSGSRGQNLGPLGATLGALACLFQQPFALPTVADRLTADAFYAYVASAARRDARPILALTPDYAYFLIGQPVEIQGSGLLYLWAGRQPGVEKIPERLRRADYSVVVAVPHYVPDDDAFRAPLRERYRQVADCRLGYYYGHAIPYLVFLRRDAEDLPFQAPAGSRCYAVSP